MIPTVLCYPVREKRVLLGLKKTGVGRGKWNGFGGKVEPGEPLTAAAMRELREECGLEARAEDLIEVGTIWYAYPLGDSEYETITTVFILKRWRGEPIETKEMTPRWFTTPPWGEMWENDREWLPLALRGKKFKARVAFEADGETTLESAIVTSLPAPRKSRPRS